MKRVAAFVTLLGVPFLVRPQSSAVPSENTQALYHEFLAQINRIQIFDNHSHPGYADDPDVDAMTSPPGSSALRLRADNPELIAASKALFSYPYDDNSPEHMRWLIQRKAELKRTEGVQYFDRILDRLGHRDRAGQSRRYA